MYGPTNIYSAGGTKIYGKDSPTTVIAALNSTVTSPANIKLMGVFGETNTATTLQDLSGNNNTINLVNASLSAIAASTCTPGFTGFAPYLTMDATHLWNVDDTDDLSFVEPQAWSGIVLMAPVNVTNRTIYAKRVDTTGATQKEYMFSFVSGKLYIQEFDDSTGTGIQTRYYNTSLSGDIGTAYVYGNTYNGVNTQIIYRNGTRIDNSSSGSGYTAMENKAGKFASYYLDASVAIGMPASAQYMFIFITKELLSPAQEVTISTILTRYAGQ
jgi:hypothetical protein